MHWERLMRNVSLAKQNSNKKQQWLDSECSSWGYEKVADPNLTPAARPQVLTFLHIAILSNLTGCSKC
jgi:hypothetical protein